MCSDSNSPNSTLLQGKTFVVTRSIAQAPNLVTALENLGATIFVFPTIDIRPLVTEIPPQMTSVDWLVFTSANAVRGLHASARSEFLKNKFPRSRVCCVGPATEEAAKKSGLTVDLLPDIYTAGDVYEALRDREGDLRGKRILLPRGNIANPNLRDQLLKAGVQVESLMVYETACPSPDEKIINELLEAQPQMVTFTSGSTVKNFVQLLGKERLAKLLPNTRFASIGPETTKAAEMKGLKIDVEPAEHTIPGLTQAIATYYS